jgi:hypothetical protein
VVPVSGCVDDRHVIPCFCRREVDRAQLKARIRVAACTGTWDQGGCGVHDALRKSTHINEIAEGDIVGTLSLIDIR